MGSDEDCQTYAARATFGGAGQWDRNVRLVRLLRQSLEEFLSHFKILMFRFTGGVVSTEVEKRRWEEDGFLVSLKSIRYCSLFNCF